MVSVLIFGHYIQIHSSKYKHKEGMSREVESEYIIIFTYA